MPTDRGPLGDTTDEWKDRACQERPHSHPAGEVHGWRIGLRREHDPILEEAFQQPPAFGDLTAHQSLPVGNHGPDAALKLAPIHGARGAEPAEALEFGPERTPLPFPSAERVQE